MIRDTISLSADSGMAFGLSHSGSSRKRPDAALRPSSSEKTSRQVRFSMAPPMIVSPKNTAVRPTRRMMPSLSSYEVDSSVLERDGCGSETCPRLIPKGAPT